MIVSIETMMAAHIAMTRIQGEFDDSLSSISMRPSDIQIFRLEEF